MLIILLRYLPKVYPASCFANIFRILIFIKPYWLDVNTRPFRRVAYSEQPQGEFQ